MTPRMIELLSKLRHGPSPDPEIVSAAMATIPFELPRDYVEVVSEASGWTGFVSEASPYVDLWPIEEVAARNVAYDVSPGDDMLLVGSDGGGTAYALVRVGVRTAFADVPFIPLRASEARLRGDSLEEFIENLARGGHLVP